MTTYRYLTREQWGATWARPPVPEVLGDPEVYVHHTAGNPYDTLDAVQAFQTLNQIAILDKGYSFLDYDILVHYNRLTDVLTIGEGRGEWLSAATRNRNEIGEAICVFGYFHPPSSDPNHYSHRYTARPLDVHVEGVARGIMIGIDEGWIAPDARILGHRENPAHPGDTGCPGNYWYDVVDGRPSAIDRVKSRVAELKNPPPTLPETTVPKFVLTPASPTAVWRVEGDDAHRVTAEEARRRRAEGTWSDPVKISQSEALKLRYWNEIHQGAVGLS